MHFKGLIISESINFKEIVCELADNFTDIHTTDRKSSILIIKVLFQGIICCESLYVLNVEEQC